MLAEARAKLLADMDETAWQAQAEALADHYKWLHYHPPDNRPITARSGKKYVQNIKRGFPDLVLVHPRLGLLMFAELKTEKGRLSPAQKEWREAFTRVAGVRYEVLRPTDADRLEAMLDPGRLEGWGPWL